MSLECALFFRKKMNGANNTLIVGSMSTGQLTKKKFLFSSFFLLYRHTWPHHVTECALFFRKKMNGANNTLIVGSISTRQRTKKKFIRRRTKKTVTYISTDIEMKSKRQHKWIYATSRTAHTFNKNKNVYIPNCAHNLRKREKYVIPNCAYFLI